MQPKHLNLQILSEQVDLHSFNCGDEDLNDFLINNAYQSMIHRMSLTYILKENEQVVAYFSLLFDKISKEDTRNTTSFIEFKSKNYHFSKIRDIKPCQSIFCFGKYIKIYLQYDENNKNDKYPIRTLYLDNNDHIKLIEEFYTDYREKENRKSETFPI